MFAPSPSVGLESLRRSEPRIEKPLLDPDLVRNQRLHHCFFPQPFQ